MSGSVIFLELQILVVLGIPNWQIKLLYIQSHVYNKGFVVGTLLSLLFEIFCVLENACTNRKYPKTTQQIREEIFLSYNFHAQSSGYFNCHK